MSELIYSLNNVSFSYNNSIKAVNDLSLTIYQGECAAIIGANGTGKSTLLSMLDVLIFPDTGIMQFSGKELTEKIMNDVVFQRFFRSRVGYVFQNPDIQLFCPTVLEDICFGPLQLGIGKEEVKKRSIEVAEKLKLGHILDRAPHQLSVGEKKKVAIASVLTMNTGILLLDEPTAGLDPQTTRDIIAVLNEAHKSGKTVIFATHDLHIVEEIADMVYVFGHEKKIIRSGIPEEILKDHSFLQKHNLVHIHVHRHFHNSHIHEHSHSKLPESDKK